MTDDLKITINFGRAKSDIAKLKRIMEDMDNYKTTTSDKDEAIRQWKEEFHRRLVAAGLSK